MVHTGLDIVAVGQFYGRVVDILAIVFGNFSSPSILLVKVLEFHVEHGSLYFVHAAVASFYVEILGNLGTIASQIAY